MKKFLIGYGVTGVILAVSVVMTGSRGLSEKNQQIYEMALEEDAADSFGFHDLSLRDIKVRFYDGTYDYVTDEEGFHKESPVYDFYVGSIADVDGECQAVLPVYEQFSSLIGTGEMFGSLAAGSDEFEENSYTEEDHAATIWHEAFHVWQMNYFENEMNTFSQEAGITEEQSFEEILVSEIDTDEADMVSLKQEISYLLQAAESSGMEQAEMIRQALKEEEERRSRMSEAEIAVEEYYESVEGSARYVESMAYKSQKGEEEWKACYLSDEQEISGGSDKYYRIGMLKCLLLDARNPEWKEQFQIPMNYSEMLMESLQ